MTLSKPDPSGGEAEVAATPYRGSRCCVGFFQCHVCGHEWSSVFSWANTGQLCKPCSSKRRQTWVLPFRQIPKSRKYEFFCIDCDQYVAESYRSRDAHQGVACKACQGVVFPDWEFPCDACNVVHLYSFSKTDAMRGIDCECGVLLFPKHMKSLNRKHESRYCQKCQELGVNCCNFKARPSVEKDVAGAASASKNSSATAKKPAKKSSRPRKDQRTSVSSVDAASGAEMKSPGSKKSAPRRKPKVSVSSVEGEASSNKVSGPKKSAPRRKPKPSVSSVDEGADKENASSGRKPGQRRKKRASASSVEDEVVEKTAVNRKSGQRSKKRASASSVEEAPKKPAARRAKPKPRVSVSSADGGASADERTEKKSPRRRPAPKGRKQLEQAVEGEGIVDASDIRVTKSSPRGRGGRGGVRGRGGALRGRGGALKQRVHVYGEDDVLRHARTPKNSVATDPGIREPKKPLPQRRSKTDRGDSTISGGADAEVDALADQVAESVIISAKRVIVEENNNVIVAKEDVVDKAPRQQKDENDDNSIILERKEEAKVVGTEDAVVGAETVVDIPSPSKSKTAATAGVELKGGHPPAIKVGGRRRVSSLRKSESEGKKVENQESEDGAAEEAAVSKEVLEADPENSQVQVVVKSRSVTHSEMASVPEKPSPTKEVNRMPKVHPHHPTNKHPIQQPRK